jgi:drug/metabolite transporter (DMT)-like permease
VQFVSDLHQVIIVARDATSETRRPVTDERPYRRGRMPPRSATATPAPPALSPETHRLTVRDWVTLALPGLIWGSSFYLIAEGLDSFEPFLVTWLRIVFGFVVVAATPAARRSVPRSSWPRLGVLAVVWIAVPISLFPLAEERVSSSVTGMLNGATPIFTAIVAALIVRSLPPQRQLLGLVVGLAGIVLIAVPTWSSDAQEGSSAVGVVMVLCALACYGVALNIAAPLQRALGALPVIGRILGIAVVLLAPFGLAAIDGSQFSWSSAIAVAVLGAFGTGVAYVLMASNAGRYGSTRASSTTYLIPGVSIMLGVAFRGESVDWIALVGCAVALVGAYLVNTAYRPVGSTGANGASE